MKRLFILLIFSMPAFFVACSKKNGESTYNRFQRNYIELFYNNGIRDSMFVDFDHDNIYDLSIFAYWIKLGSGIQESYYSLNTFNTDYRILVAEVSDTTCLDTTMSGNLVTSSNFYNCNSPSGVVHTDTFAVSSDQCVIIPAGFYKSGLVEIYKENRSYHPPYIENTDYGNNRNGYFFIKNFHTNKMYVMSLREDNMRYILQDVKTLL